MPLTFKQLIEHDASREQIEDWCRSRTQSYAIVGDRGGSVMMRVLGKYLMAGVSEDVALTPHLALDGIWEPWVTMAIARHVKPGMRCMDVGACYGYYSLLMADLAGFCQAWEPKWHAAITVNAMLNGLTIEVVPDAMGASPRPMQLVRPKVVSNTKFFNAGGYSLAPWDPNTNLPQVRMRPPHPGSWDFIKIDVEGAEADVWLALAGVRELSPHLTVCMEFTPSTHTDPMAFIELLMNDGFELGTVGHDGVPRACSLDEALVPDTGDFRMLWLTRTP